MEPQQSPALTPVSLGDYAPSPNTCSMALSRAGQLRVQTLLKQLLQANQSTKLDTLRVLRKTLRELDYQLNWLTQLDLLDTMERLLAEETSTGFVQEEEGLGWRLVEDCTQLLIESIPKLPFTLEPQTVDQLFGLVVENLGHQRSEVRRASLLLMNLYLKERPAHFQLILRLFIEHGLRNGRSPAAQRGAVLSLPLLMSEQVVEGENLLPLIRCLGELLVSTSHSQLFYSLYLALQRLHLTIGDHRFWTYLRQCDPEAILLYRQAASRSNSLAMAGCSLDEPQTTDAPTAEQQQVGSSSDQVKQVTFEDDQTGDELKSEEEERAELSSAASSEVILDTQLTSPEHQRDELSSQSSSSSRATGAPIHRRQSTTIKQRSLSSVSSTCSSEENLVDPSHYMGASALSGRPMADYERIHQADHSNTGLCIDDLGACCTPTRELGPAGIAPHELKFGIFPRHLVNAALQGRQADRIEALEEMMRIIRDSPINHLAILMTYFDSFLRQFLGQLLGGPSPVKDHRLELVGVDMIETLVVKTKLSCVQYVRPMVSLLWRTLQRADEGRLLVLQQNTVRVVHKMMAYLPPQHVIDAIFEHKHARSPLLREQAVNRVTCALLDYDKQEFNLTKLAYHVLPMLADHYSPVRLAALECIATLAQALGPERIGSLLTAAEAVQTGCDLDGLLDAIHARLSRRSLPRCLADGSLRYVIRPFLLQGSREQQAADVRWVLEAPSSHQHQHHPADPPPSQSHHHRLGVYEPDDPLVKRRSSMGCLDMEPERSHQHHHLHHQQPQEPHQPDEAAENSGIEASSSRPAVQATNCTSQERPQNRSNIQQVKSKSKSSSSGDNASEINKTPSVRRPSVGQTRLSKSSSTSASAERSPVRRCSSQESRASSGDTNKALFQYYLDKFRQSLMEQHDSSAGETITRPSNRLVLPSDSIIYTDNLQAYALSRHRTRQLQTSFDYEPHSGKVPVTQEASQWRQEEARPHDELGDVQLEEQIETSGSDSPLTVMEASSKQRRHQRRPSADLGQHQHKGADETQQVSASSQRVSHQDYRSSGESRRRKSVADSGLPVPSVSRSRQVLARQSASLSMDEPNSNEASSAEPKEAKSVEVQSGSSPPADQHRRRSRAADGASSSSGSTSRPEGSQQSRRESRRRRSAEQPDDEVLSNETYASGEGAEWVPPENRQAERLQEQRRRASRSQPPSLQRKLTRTPSKSRLTGEQRAVSVSPSLASNANIRHILENVAEAEGPFQDQQLALRVAMDALESPAWSTKVEGVLATIRLTAHHQPLVLSHLHELVGRLALETRNLRSTVARSAIFALGDMSRQLGRQLESELDLIVQALLSRAAENTAFIRDDIRRALATMVEHLTHWRLAGSLIQHGANHKNVNVRRMASQFVAALVERTGAAKCLVGAREISGQLIPAAVKFAQDGSPHTRYYGRLILAKLVQHSAFGRLAGKNLAPNLYRSSLGIIESVRRRGAGEPPAES